MRGVVGNRARRDARGVDDHEAAAAFQERVESLTLLDREAAAILRIHHEHVRLRELRGGGQFEAAVHLHAALGEELRPFAEETRMRVDFLATVGRVCADEHA